MRTELDRGDRWVAVAMAPTILGGLAVLVDWSSADVPPAVGALGLVAFAGGCVIAGSAAYLDSRRRGVGFGTSLWRGFKMLLRWLAAFFP